MELQQNVAANVHRIRRERGLSQDDFGKAIGVHRTWVGAVERGERNLTLESVEKLAKALGVKPLELLAKR